MNWRVIFETESGGTAIPYSSIVVADGLTEEIAKLRAESLNERLERIQPRRYGKFHPEKDKVDP